jgi:hypothetical protein
MQVYHGSYMEIFEIDLSKSQSDKDFGRGFYVTKFRRHAESWASNMARRHHKKPVVTEFTFYERAFEEERYKVLRFDGYSETWLDFVVLNRDPSTTVNQHEYDIVEGPIANDKIQNRIIEFLAGLITKNDFLDELKYHEETHQICFCTLNSLQMLKKADQKFTALMVRINESVVSQLILDNAIDESKAADIFFGSQTFVNLSDESMGLYLKPWQEIYEMLKMELKM